MALEIPTFLVRHGRYNAKNGDLSSAGIEDMNRACQKLVELGVGASALILSSTAPRAEQSAQILHTKLATELSGEQNNVIPSRALNEKGNHPFGLEESLDDLLEEAIKRNGKTQAGHSGLVVVTHAPLIALAIDKNPYAIPGRVTTEGGVYQYELNSWVDVGHRLRQY